MGRERWYRQAKATKRGERGGRESERLESTAEAGELAPEDPVEGSEASVGRPDRGKHAEPIEVHPHVHGTRPESHGDPVWGWRICRLRNRMLSCEHVRVCGSPGGQPPGPPGPKRATLLAFNCTNQLNT